MRSHRGRVEARGTRRQPGHSSRTLPVATQVNYERPSVRPSVSLASRSLFHSAARSSRLVALYLYAPATATLPMEVDGRSVATQRTRHIIALQSTGRACDEWRQIAGGTRWINLLSTSSVTSPRHSCSSSSSSSSRIVAPAHSTVAIILPRRPTDRRTHCSTQPSNPPRTVAQNCSTGLAAPSLSG